MLKTLVRTKNSCPKSSINRETFSWNSSATDDIQESGTPESVLEVTMPNSKKDIKPNHYVRLFFTSKNWYPAIQCSGFASTSTRIMSSFNAESICRYSTKSTHFSLPWLIDNFIRDPLQYQDSQNQFLWYFLTPTGHWKSQKLKSFCA